MMTNTTSTSNNSETPSRARNPIEDSLLTSLGLLDRLQNLDDQSAWREFFDRYWRLIYNFSMQAGLSDADSQDIVQDVMVNLTTSLERFEPDAGRGRFKTWLLTIVKRRIIDLRRRRGRHPEAVGESAVTPLVEEAELERIWDGEWQRHLLGSALKSVRKRVAARHFMIYDLLIRQGASVKEVCRALDTNPATVYLAKHRVSKLVRQEVAQLERPMLAS